MKTIKNLRTNIIICLTGAAFFIGGFVGVEAAGQKEQKNGAAKKPSATRTPTRKTTVNPPAAKKSPTTPKPPVKTSPVKTPLKSNSAAAPVAAPKSAAKPAPKKPELPLMIVTVTSARVRTAADLTADTMQYAKLGATFPVISQNEKWYQVRVSKTEADAGGWISKTVSQDFTSAKRGATYQSIAAKYLKQPAIDFTTAVQVFDFLTTATGEIKDEKTLADLSLKRLQMLSAALKKVAVDRQTEQPYQSFLKTNEGDIVYSEPSAQWLVRSESFWELHGEYKNLPFGEEIAWTAAQNPIPGECEGYINCYLYQLRATEGEYLNFYPNGKYSRQSLKNMTNLLEPIAADATEKTVYTSANDTSDRADFNRYLTELRSIISKTPYIEKAKPLAQIRQIAEAHR